MKTIKSDFSLQFLWLMRPVIVALCLCVCICLSDFVYVPISVFVFKKKATRPVSVALIVDGVWSVSVWSPLEDSRLP